MSEQTCGNCKWGKFDRGERIGECEVPLPDLPPIPRCFNYLSTAEAKTRSAIWVNLLGCPTWEAK